MGLAAKFETTGNLQFGNHSLLVNPLIDAVFSAMGLLNVIVDRSIAVMSGVTRLAAILELAQANLAQSGKAHWLSLASTARYSQ